MQKQFTANVPAPDKMCLEGNLSQNWKRFKRQLGNHCIASRLSREEGKNYQVAVFLAVFGPGACEIYGKLKFEAPDDKNDLKIEDFFVEKAFESYKFHLRKQEESESIEAYVAALRKLTRTCNFDKLEERLTRDQVVVGVRQESLREKTLEDKGLILDKRLSFGRAYESSKQQLQSMPVKENHLKCNACSTRRNKAATCTRVIPQSKEGEEMKIHQENAQDVKIFIT